MLPMVTDMFIQCRNVLSLAACTVQPPQRSALMFSYTEGDTLFN